MIRLKRNGRYPWSPMDVYLETDWQWLITLAWGKRRLSRRVSPAFRAQHENPKKPGRLLHGVTGATLATWIDWYLRNRKQRFDYVVVEGAGADHGADYLERIERDNEQKAVIARQQDILSRLGDLQRKRAEARAAKDFALADAIRAEIESAGISVRDEKLTAKIGGE